jgi:TatD DNase family protein
LERKNIRNYAGFSIAFWKFGTSNHAIDLQFILGIGGVVTFKNGKIDQFLNEIPLDKIVLETDSPYLAPVPFRGKRNESAYVELVAGKLVDIYKTDFRD